MVYKTAVTDHDLDGLFVREMSPAARRRTGHPLVFIHGGFHGWWTWERWQPFLADLGWHTYAISLPGHTDSKPLPDAELAALDLDDYARSVRHVLNRLVEPAPILVGHSMGGVIAQMVAQETDPSALVLVASGRPRGRPFRADLPLGKPILMGKEEARGVFFHVIDDEEFDRVFQRLCPESPIAMNDLSSGDLVGAPRFECPALVLTAQYDRTYIDEFADHAAHTYHATRAVVLNAGHDLMLDSTWCDAAVYLHSWLVTTVPTVAPTVRTLFRG